MAALTYQEQEVLSAGQRLLRQGKPLYKEDRQEVHKSTNKPMRALIPGLLVIISALQNINLVGLMLNIPVNSHGHVVTVSPPYLFPGQA